MDPHALEPVITSVWLYGAAPLAALAALVLTVRLRLPQLLGLAEAFRAMRRHDPSAEGSVHPATSVAMVTVATQGGAAAVGAATAVSLGGAGAIAWLWLIAFLIMPLRMAEAALARTSPPGKAGARTGTLAHRLLADPQPALRVLGFALVALVPLVGLAFVGGTHGGAVIDAAEQLLPGSALPLGLTVAGLAALAGVAPLRRAGSILGWIGAVALIALFGAALFAFFSEPGRAFGSFGRAFSDAFYGAPSVAAFSGALTGEIARAALLHLLPPLAAVGGVEGAWHGEAQAPTTRGYARAALLAPLLSAGLTTLVGLSLVATGAFSRPVETTRPLREVTFYRVGFESVSQRNEVDRRYDGFLRVTDGSTGVVELHAGTDRGMIRTPTFEDGGEPANLAVHVGDGLVDHLQKPGELGALVNRPLAELDQVVMRGRMLPRGGALLAASMSHAGGSIVSRVALAALLLLAALGAAAWGFGVRKTLCAVMPERAALGLGALPGVGVAIAALAPEAGLVGVGLVLAGVLVAVASVALLARSGAAADVTK